MPQGWPVAATPNCQVLSRRVLVEDPPPSATSSTAVVVGSPRNVVCSLCHNHCKVPTVDPVRQRRRNLGSVLRLQRSVNLRPWRQLLKFGVQPLTMILLLPIIRCSLDREKDNSSWGYRRKSFLSQLLPSPVSQQP